MKQLTDWIDKVFLRFYQIIFHFIILAFFFTNLQIVTAQELKYQKPASHANNPNAQFQRAMIYYQGKEASQPEYTKAYSLFLKSAESHHAQSQYYLGFMYYYGQGVEQNYSMARDWFEQAARQNIDVANYYLGFMYEHGQSVVQNLKQAQKFYQIAVQSGNQKAKERLIELQKITHIPSLPLIPVQKNNAKNIAYPCTNQQIQPIVRKVVKGKCRFLKPWTDYSGCDFQKKDFKGLDLRGASFQNMDLTHTNFTNAKLQYANFTNAKLHYTKLNNANLSGAIFKNTELFGSHLEKATICQVTLENTIIQDSFLYRADFQGAVIHQNSQINSSFLVQANFAQTIMTQSSFQNSVLYKVQWKKAQLFEMNFNAARGIPFWLSEELTVDGLLSKSLLAPE